MIWQQLNTIVNFLVFSQAIHLIALYWRKFFQISSYGS
ncbi:hypothetical protein PNIG_a3746 [Pseudoalteromonas nigrifaciens]|uniref:Uncharacterized protein n=1 Tax=Pseudoalteromonas nigrifaciens TaxID=28109 RepID=A0AAC9UI19_9GAMM|nr:hypothetical protein PNIG_a3746 [Pseudoalteromonas nigrifaciens]